MRKAGDNTGIEMSSDIHHIAPIRDKTSGSQGSAGEAIGSGSLLTNQRSKLDKIRGRGG